MSTAQPKLGQRVQVAGKNQLCGRVAYVGHTTFAGGQWFGIVLDEPRGKNNGTVHGSTYFKCAPNCGLFVRAQQLQLLLNANQLGESKSKQDNNRTKDGMQRESNKLKLTNSRQRSRQAAEEQVSHD